MSTPAIERAFSTLATYGVPRERARSISNGIDVLVTRYQRQVQDLTAEINSLKAKIAESEAVPTRAHRDAVLDELARLSEQMGGYDLPSAAPTFPVHADPTGKTREPPHCPTCECQMTIQPEEGAT